jgi:DNA-binding NarL/FixJ family response regulator
MRILIVDDHALVRRGMTYVVKEGFPDADVVEAEGANAALDLMRSKAADLALVDVRMPDLDGLELLRAMKLEWPDVPVIMLSTYENAPYVKRALAMRRRLPLPDATPEDLGRRSTSRSRVAATSCHRASSRTCSRTWSPREDLTATATRSLAAPNTT